MTTSSITGAWRWPHASSQAAALCPIGSKLRVQAQDLESPRHSDRHSASLVVKKGFHIFTLHKSQVKSPNHQSRPPISGKLKHDSGTNPASRNKHQTEEASLNLKAPVASQKKHPSSASPTASGNPPDSCRFRAPGLRRSAPPAARVLGSPGCPAWRTWRTSPNPKPGLACW